MRHNVYDKTQRTVTDRAYPSRVPKLWEETIDAHRRSVRDAILGAASTLVAERGLRSVTMAQIAERTGIGRATLYKYFPDVDAMLLAWHERQVSAHLDDLTRLRDEHRDAGDALAAVLEAYARMHYELAAHHGAGRGLEPGADIAALLHRGEHVARAERHLRDFMRDLIGQAAQAGAVRDDLPAHELAGYCLHSLTAAATLPSKAAVERLVRVTLAGLRTQG